jgi:SRSO17 transposase
MPQILSDLKKFHQKGYLVDNKEFNVKHNVYTYDDYFTVYRRSNTDKAFSYIVGLMKCEKNHTNMERMVEQVPEMAYHQYHNFLSESKWDHVAVNNKTAIDSSELMGNLKSQSKNPTGLIIDESSHMKKGQMSVGVSRQYAGVSGKVDNCQVAVYASLCNGENATLIDTALFIPQKWIDDAPRCKKAGIPEENRVFATKPEKAFAIIKRNQELGVKWDWIGGDGLYGHNAELTRKLDEENLFYVLDVHKDELIYLEEPTFAIPPKKSSRGRTPVKAKPDKSSIQIDEYCKSIKSSNWERVKIRKTTKGWKFVHAHTVTVWHWDNTEAKARQRILVITKTEEKNPKIKYSFSNGSQEQYSNKEYAYFQCNRYWVERCFDDTKNELGLSGYQVRKWIAWHHHQSLVMMSALFLLKARISQNKEYELMSLRDTRIMIIAHLFLDQETITILHNQMLARHKSRKKDIDRYYQNEDQS